MNRKCKFMITICFFILAFIVLYDLFKFTLFPINGGQNIEEHPLGNKAIEKWDDFYSKDKNTIDLIFLGSSHSNNTFIPMIIDNINKTDSYTLGSHGLVIGQFELYINEILKHQNPKIIVFELFSIIHRASDDLSEDNPSINGIRPSINISQITKNNKKFDIKQVFPIVDYHSNWKDKDFSNRLEYYFNPYYSYIPYNGYEITKGTYIPVRNNPIFCNKLEISYDSTSFIIPEQSLESLKKAVNICHENNIEVIFTFAPMRYASYNPKENILAVNLLKNQLTSYIDSNNIKCIDYNELTNELGITTSDFFDSSHLNASGAYKVSTHFSQYIADNYTEYLDTCRSDYTHDTQIKLNSFLDEYDSFINVNARKILANDLNTKNYKSNMYDYLTMLNDDNYITIISSRNNKPKYLDTKITNIANILGLNFDMRNNIRSNYIAVINNGICVEIIDNKAISIEKDAEKLISLDLPFELDVISSNINNGFESIIKIDNKNYSKNRDGFNIVIYDKILGAVVSTANFNLNQNQQNYFDKELAQLKYDKSKIVYIFDTSKEIEGLVGASTSEAIEEGVLIHSNSTNPGFSLNKFESQSNHLLLKAEIECSKATWFELNYNGTMEREQLVTGNNTIYIEMRSTELIKNIRIEPSNNEGNYLIKCIEVCDLSEHNNDN